MSAAVTSPASPAWRAIAVAGLALLAALLLAGTSLPDPASLLGSAWLALLPAALAAALIWNLGDRLRKRRAARGRPGSARFRSQLEWSAPGDATAEATRLAGLLRRGGYRVEREGAAGEVTLCGRRGDLGFWGSIGFHLALVLAMVAVGLTIAAQRNGAITLVEGTMTRLDDPGATRVDRAGALAPAFPPVALELTGFEARFEDERFPVDYRAAIRADVGAGAAPLRAIARVNDPVTVEGSRLTLQRYGVAPLLDVTTRAGVPVVRAPVLLSVLEGRSDDFELPGEGVWLRARYLGDLVEEAPGQVSSRSDLPRNPALLLTPLSPDRAHVAGPTLLLRRGEAATLGPHRIAFPELRHWVELGVDRDPGLPVLVVASLLACLGLALRFWDHEREVWLRIGAEGAGVRVAAAARSRYFPALTRLALERLREAA